jgi:hypothetical protein
LPCIAFGGRGDALDHSALELAGAEHEFVAGVDVVGVCRIAGFAAVRVVHLVAEQLVLPRWW